MIKKIIYAHDIVENNHSYLNDSMYTKYNAFSKLVKKHYNKFDKLENLFLKSNSEKYFLTFDDGYKSFNDLVLPLIEKYNIPATIFITTDFINNNKHPYELLLNEVINNLNELSIENTSFKINTIPKKKELYNTIRKSLKSENTKVREKYLKKIFYENHYNYINGEYFLNWDEIKQLDRNPLVTIGAHTRTHPSLGKIGYWDAFKEIFESKKIIESKLKHKVSYFSYPYGGLNIAVKAFTILSGYKLAFTTQEKSIDDIENNKRYTIPRIDLNSMVL